MTFGWRTAHPAADRARALIAFYERSISSPLWPQWGIVRHTGRRLAATLVLEHKPETWMKFVVVPLARGRWVWVMRDADGLTVCESATSYISRERAFSAIHEIRAKASDAEIVEPPETGSEPPN